MMKTISAKELDGYVQDGTTLIIDLRSRMEYADGHIRGAVNVPYGNFKTGFPGRGEKKILLYCERGSLSLSVARELHIQGYDTISVVGGIRAYRGKNLVRRQST